MTLKGVFVRGEWSVKLPHFPNIRKLSIQLMEDEKLDWEAMVNSLVQLEHLTSLHVYTDRMTKERAWIIPAFRNFKQLLSLSLPISIYDPDFETMAKQIIDKSGLFPPNLVKLRLLSFEMGKSCPTSSYFFQVTSDRPNRITSPDTP